MWTLPCSPTPFPLRFPAPLAGAQILIIQSSSLDVSSSHQRISQGVLARALWVREDIERQGYIRALLGNEAGDGRGGVGQRESGSGLRPERGGRGGPPPPPLSSVRISRCRGYSLRITGHSLGGGTGALLTYMMRRDYPSARCIAISPIGGLLNAPFAEQCGEFVLSAVLGKDMVPRLSVTSMERMRDEVLDLIARSKV